MVSEVHTSKDGVQVGLDPSFRVARILGSSRMFGCRALQIDIADPPRTITQCLQIFSRVAPL
jgi:hypothetical protein